MVYDVCHQKSFLIMASSLQHATLSVSIVYNSAYFGAGFICIYGFKLISDDVFQNTICMLTAWEFSRSL